MRIRKAGIISNTAIQPAQAIFISPLADKQLSQVCEWPAIGYFLSFNDLDGLSEILFTLIRISTGLQTEGHEVISLEVVRIHLHGFLESVNPLDIVLDLVIVPAQVIMSVGIIGIAREEGRNISLEAFIIVEHESAQGEDLVNFRPLIAARQTLSSQFAGQRKLAGAERDGSRQECNVAVLGKIQPQQLNVRDGFIPSRLAHQDIHERLARQLVSLIELERLL